MWYFGSAGPVCRQHEDTAQYSMSRNCGIFPKIPRWNASMHCIAAGGQIEQAIGAWQIRLMLSIFYSCDPTFSLGVSPSISQPNGIDSMEALLMKVSHSFSGPERLFDSRWCQQTWPVNGDFRPSGFISIRSIAFYTRAALSKSSETSCQTSFCREPMIQWIPEPLSLCPSQTQGVVH